MFLNNFKKLFCGIKILLISIIDSFFIKSVKLENFNSFVPYPNHLEYAPLTIFSNNCLSKNWNCTNSRKCIVEIDVQDMADLFIKSF